MNAMRHVTPFKNEVTEKLMLFSDISDTIDRWIKVQLLWTSLEAVFTGGDIVKQMPTEARKFQQIDKNWIKIMEKAAEQQIVLTVCQNEMLKQMLPTLQKGLEECQKSLDSYLEAKRNKFARFYFTSAPVLLKILSQGSDPNQIQDDLEKLFDAISKVRFDVKDKKLITHILGVSGRDEEVIELSSSYVKADGNIEDWLKNLEEQMQKSLREISCVASRDCLNKEFKDFVEGVPAQIALMGLQIL